MNLLNGGHWHRFTAFCHRLHVRAALNTTFLLVVAHIDDIYSLHKTTPSTARVV
jgi:hypothetical protein